MEQLTGKGRLSRRAFIGASAGTAAAAAAAGLGPFRPGAGADADPAAHDMILPTYRVGWQIFTGPTNQTWRSGTQSNPGELAENNTLPVAHAAGVHAFEGASNRYEGFPNTPEGHELYAQWAVANRVRLIGDHAGPNPKSNPTSTPNVNNINLAVAKMAAWEQAGNTRALGIGGSTPGQNAGTTVEAQQANVDAYLTHAELLNERGRLYQEGFGGSDTLAGARYYQHTHREWATWHLIDPGDPDYGKWANMRQMEVMFDPDDGLDPDFAFMEIDWAWLYSGIRRDSNIIFGDGAWTQEQIQDECVRIMELYGDDTPFYHVKDTTPATGGGSSNGSAADTGDPLGDNFPFQRVIQNLRDPSEHEYLIERDGAGGRWADVMTWAGTFLNGHDQDFGGGNVVPGIQLDRSLVGAPANATPPSILEGPQGPGSGSPTHQVRGNTQGKWVRDPEEFSFRWLRDGIPILGSDTRNFRSGPEDSGKEIVAEVRAHNQHGSTTENTEPVVPA